MPKLVPQPDLNEVCSTFFKPDSEDEPGLRRMWRLMLAWKNLPRNLNESDKSLPGICIPNASNGKFLDPGALGRWYADGGNSINVSNTARYLDVEPDWLAVGSSFPPNGGWPTWLCGHQIIRNAHYAIDAVMAVHIWEWANDRPAAAGLFPTGHVTSNFNQSSSRLGQLISPATQDEWIQKIEAVPFFHSRMVKFYVVGLKKSVKRIANAKLRTDRLFEYYPERLPDLCEMAVEWAMNQDTAKNPAAARIRRFLVNDPYWATDPMNLCQGFTGIETEEHVPVANRASTTEAAPQKQAAAKPIDKPATAATPTARSIKPIPAVFDRQGTRDRSR